MNAKEELECPLCRSSKLNEIGELISKINNKNYKHYYCKNCELEFFTPLVFENIYDNEQVGGYIELHKGRREYPEWTKRLIKNIKKFNINLKNKKILEIGAGDGINYLALKENFGIDETQYYAIELDNKSIEICKKRGIKNVVNCFFDKSILNRMDCDFDIVIATEVLEHQINPREFLDIIFKILKKEGILFITVPNRDRFFIKYRELDDIPPHHFLRFNKKFFMKNFEDRILLVEDFLYENKNFLKKHLLLVLEHIRGYGIMVIMKK